MYRRTDNCPSGRVSRHLPERRKHDHCHGHLQVEIGIPHCMRRDPVRSVLIGSLHASHVCRLCRLLTVGMSSQLATHERHKRNADILRFATLRAFCGMDRCHSQRPGSSKRMALHSFTFVIGCPTPSKLWKRKRRPRANSHICRPIYAPTAAIITLDESSVACLLLCYPGPPSF